MTMVDSRKATLALSTLGYGKRILVVLSEWGYWGEELIGPLDVLTKAGYQLDFMTSFGRKPPALPPAWKKDIWIHLHKVVTDAHYAKRTTEVMSQIFSTIQSICQRRFR